MNSNIFLKGYQWPFDSSRITGGSSIIDILVYIETVIKGRRVFLDFQKNSKGFNIEKLDSEPREYLTRSGALQPRPIDRLEAMNPDAIRLYRDNGIDIAREPLEIAVCAQHNNGGLAGNIWWESTNIRHLFPVGEVNGTHGVKRPGGSALNSGQVGGYRAAEFIANRYNEWTIDFDRIKKIASTQMAGLWDWIGKSENSDIHWRSERDMLQSRMTRSGAHIRSLESLRSAVKEAWEQWNRLRSEGCGFKSAAEMHDAVNTLQLCYAHAVLS